MLYDSKYIIYKYKIYDYFILNKKYNKFIILYFIINMINVKLYIASKSSNDSTYILFIIWRKYYLII